MGRGLREPARPTLVDHTHTQKSAIYLERPTTQKDAESCIRGALPTPQASALESFRLLFRSEKPSSVP